IVSAGDGLPEEFYAELRVEHGLRGVAPVVEGSVTTDSGVRLRLLGIDPFAGSASGLSAARRPGGERLLLTTPGAVALSDDLAARLGVSRGDAFTVRTSAGEYRLVAADVLATESATRRDALADLLVADIATAQEALGTLGRLTRIDVVAMSDPDIVRLGALLPPSATIVPASERADTLDAMTRAFRVNLTAMSLLALVFGMFLVHSAVSFSVVRRRHLMGTLRVLGVTPRELRVALVVEAALIGLAGTALGLVLGSLVGRGLVHLVTRTISDLYFVVTVRSMAFSGLTIAKGVALGVGGAILAALPSVRAATATPPGDALRRSTVERASLRGARRVALAGAGVAIAGAGLLGIPNGDLLLGFAGLFALLIGLSLLVPLSVWVVARACKPAAGWIAGTLGRVAIGGVSDSLSRTGTALAALMAAVAVTVAVDAMIRSMRGTVMSWLSATLRADVYASTGRDGRPIPVEFIEEIESDPSVAYVSTYRRVDARSRTGAVALVVVRIDARGREAYSFRGAEPDGVWSAFESGAGVLVSEPLAYKRRLDTGGVVSLLTEGGLKDYRVLGVYYDYGSTEGEVTISRSGFDADWTDRSVTSLGVYVTEPEIAGAVTATVRKRAAAFDVDVHARTNRALRDAAVAVFDRTFAITGVLRLLTGAVAFVGVFAALMSLQIEKRREYAVLRAIGATPAQVFRVVVAQTGFMGLAAGIFAVPVGSVLAAVMVYVINRRSFGWTIDLTLGADAFARGVLIAVVAAVLAGLYPAARLARATPAAALREE
ncbi:FtsX-like permease family protein, partial [Candidatus Poribacteria bacterium]|nr:FtsX-like permease family protein [Candidatus Poribacteria bacterium]